MLTAKQLEEIKARAEKATKGPWIAEDEYGDALDRSISKRKYNGIEDIITDEFSPEGPWIGETILQVCPSISSQIDTPAACSGCEDVTCNGVIKIKGDNAAFIANARTDVPALLAEVERLRERNEKLERVAEAAKGCLDGAGRLTIPTTSILITTNMASLRDALSALDEQEASDAQDR